MGMHLPRVKFLTTLSTIFIMFISKFCFLYSFFRTTNEEKSELEKSMKAVQAMIEPQQNKLDSQYSQTFSHHALYILFLQQPNEEKSELKKSIEAMQEAERKFQKMLASSIS